MEGRVSGLTIVIVGLTMTLCAILGGVVAEMFGPAGLFVTAPVSVLAGMGAVSLGTFLSRR